ncbi:MAG: D-alanyl-D-alanine carboxypeptidase (penicillin-binding protein 5/6), partial [Paracoccaceae bacterium]
TEFPFDNRSPANRYNRNPLLKLGIGADGLKTGHTSEAGYGVVGSATKNGRRVVIMVTGLGSEEDRALEAEKLVNWAFRQFVEKKILATGEVVASADIWLGRQPAVDLEVAQDLTLLLPAAAAKQLRAEITFLEPIEAPIEKGQQLGVMKILVPDMAAVEIPLLAAQSVEKSGFVTKLKLAAALLTKSLMDIVN